MKKQTLSDKVLNCEDGLFFSEKDIKDFIKQLKYELDESTSVPVMHTIIDKLAGVELTK